MRESMILKQKRKSVVKPAAALLLACASLFLIAGRASGGELMLEEAAGLAAGRINAIATSFGPMGERPSVCLFPFQAAPPMDGDLAHQTQKAVEANLKRLESLNFVAPQSAIDALEVFMPGLKIGGLTDADLAKLGKAISVDFIVQGTIEAPPDETLLKLDVAMIGEGEVRHIRPTFRLDRPEGSDESAAIPFGDALPESGGSDLAGLFDGASLGSEMEGAEGVAEALEGGAGMYVPLRAVLPAEKILDVALFEIAPGGRKGVFMLTSSSLRAFGFRESDALEEAWVGPFKKKFPERGLAGFLRVREQRDGQRIIVALNQLRKPIVYQWNGDSVTKKDTLVDPLLDWLPEWKAELYSSWGAYDSPGVISFLGSNSYLKELDLNRQVHEFSFKFPVDYYDGCFIDGAAEGSATKIAILDEGGKLKIYDRQGRRVFHSQRRYGGRMICLPPGVNGGDGHLIVASDNSQGDSIYVLKFNLDQAVPIWRSAPFEGAVASLAQAGKAANGDPIILGVHEKPDGEKELFAMRASLTPDPEFEAEAAKEDEAAAADDDDGDAAKERHRE